MPLSSHHREPVSFAQWAVAVPTGCGASSSAAFTMAASFPYASGEQHGEQTFMPDTRCSQLQIGAESVSAAQEEARIVSQRDSAAATGNTRRNAANAVAVQAAEVRMRLDAATATGCETSRAASANRLHSAEMVELTIEAMEAAGLSRARRNELMRLLEDGNAQSEGLHRRCQRASALDAHALAGSAEAAAIAPGRVQPPRNTAGALRNMDAATACSQPRVHPAMPPPHEIGPLHLFERLSAPRRQPTTKPAQPATGAAGTARPYCARGNACSHYRQGDCSDHGGWAACYDHGQEDLYLMHGESAVRLRRAIGLWACEAASRYLRLRAVGRVRSVRLRRGWGEWRCAQLRRLFDSIADWHGMPSPARAWSRSINDGALARASGGDGRCNLHDERGVQVEWLGPVSDRYAQAGSRRSPRHRPVGAISRSRPLHVHPCALPLKRWHRRALAARHTISRTLAGWRARARAALFRLHRLAMLRSHLTHRALWGADRRCRRRAAVAVRRWRHAAAIRLRWAARRMLLLRVWQRRARRVLGAWWELVTVETRRESHMMSVAARWDWAAARSRAFDYIRRIRDYQIRRRELATRQVQLLGLAAAAGAFERWAAPGRANRAFGAAGVRWRQRRAVGRWRQRVGWRQAAVLLRRYRSVRLVRRVWAGWRRWVDVHSR